MVIAMVQVPRERIRPLNDAPVRGEGAFVLYWMTIHRRLDRNFALQRAVEWAVRLHRPLLVFEGLRHDYPWASDRLHRFIIEGMADNLQAAAGKPFTYLPWVDAGDGAGKGLIERLSARACVVVTDEFPCFFIPGMLAKIGPRLPVAAEAVDANGLFPLSQGVLKERAVDFRRQLQYLLPAHLGNFPAVDPTAGIALPRLRSEDLPVASDIAQLLKPGGMDHLPIDHRVVPVATVGGSRAARRKLKEFLDQKLDRYADDRSDLEADCTSGLAPYLHHGHLAVQEVIQAIWDRHGWSPDRLAVKPNGSKEGWWGLPPGSEGFLDQIITWRELGYHFCHRRPDYGTYGSLPAWARSTLDAHAGDPRQHLYDQAAFAGARTHDPLWNAAQRQLVREGTMHNYLRMLWGKKVLEWSPSPQDAVATLIELNNRYALDGRNPNSYSGIMWTFGRFDRPWAPQRPIFGTIRYMSSDNTARKMRVTGYLARYAAEPVRQERIF